MTEPLKILYVVNDGPFFLSHRLPLALAARDAGYEVHVATPAWPGAEHLRAQGLVFHDIPLLRRGTRPFQELKGFMALLRLYRGLRTDIVHHVTIKPVLYGGIAARMAGVPAVVSAVPGLGYVFINRGARIAVVRRLVMCVYRLALRQRRLRVIFQNPDDMVLFVKQGLVRRGDGVLIRGSGVDMENFSPRPEAPGTPVVLLASRMLWDKGVGEFVEAAHRLREAGVAARFVLVGDTDPGNPAAIPRTQLEAWRDAGAVEWWGHQADMQEVFAAAQVVCLPSYREGVPKVLIEAAACGRPSVATDVPGCREIVRHEVNGLLVPPRDAQALADALRRLVEDPDLRARLGRAGRDIAVAEFSLRRVIDETLGVYSDLLS